MMFKEMLKFRKLKNATHHLELGEMGFLAVERVKRMWVSPPQLRKPPMCGCIIISVDGSWSVGVMLGWECDCKWCHNGNYNYSICKFTSQPLK
jgi:hypothetical protein